MSAVEMNTVDAPVTAPMGVTPVMALLEQVKSLSFADLLAFNVGLGAHIKSEFKKVAKKAKKMKNPDAPKRPLSVGMLAWKAFVKHLVVEKPEMFVGITKAIKKQEIASEYKKEHMEDYTAFVSSFVPPVVDGSNAKANAEVVTEAPKVVTEAPKVVTEAPKVVTEAPEISSSNAAPVAEEKPKKKKEPKADGEDKPKKKKEPKADGEDKPKKKESKPESEKPKTEDQPRYKKIEVDDVTYWLITKTNEVFTCEDDDGFGEAVGTYNAVDKSIDFA